MRSRAAVALIRRLPSHGARRYAAPQFSHRARPFLRLRRAAPFVEPRRTFFGIFAPAPPEIKDPDVIPGYDTLRIFENRISLGVRPQPVAELVFAFRELFSSRLRTGAPVNSWQAFCAWKLLEYLRENPGQTEEETLSLEDLRTCQRALLVEAPGHSGEHLSLARTLYKEIQQILCDTEPRSASLEAHEDQRELLDGGLQRNDLVVHIEVLSLCGAAPEAQNLLNEALSSAACSPTDLPWIPVLRALAKEGKEAELLANAESALQHGVPYDPAFHQVMSTFFARTNNLAGLQHWFYKDLEQNSNPRSETFVEVLKYCMRNGQHEWIEDYFRALSQDRRRKSQWGHVLQWAIACHGKGVDDVRRMMGMMQGHDPELVFDADTINAVVDIATAKDDHLLAEGLMSIAHDMSIPLSAESYIRQLTYRIDAQHLSGAKTAFDALISEREGTLQPTDLAVINRYLRALCDSPTTANLAQAFKVVGAVEDGRYVLEPKTLVAVIRIYLERDDEVELLSRLGIHTYPYDYDERAVVRQALVDYILDQRNSTARVWDCYSILRQYFQETELNDRTKVMHAFFRRKRPDMACFVFGHMRQQPAGDARPTADTYADFFEALGRLSDEESLRLVHNMLKMDTLVRPNTRLRNALMMAYAAHDRPERAMEFWHEISDSPEGPSYASLEIIFTVCESAQGGDREARKIWANLQRMDVDLPLGVCAAYAAALAASGRLADVQALTQDMAVKYGHVPDVQM